MMVCGSLLLAYAGFLALAASMKKHASALLGAQPSDRVRGCTGYAGWALIVLSAVPPLLAWDVGRGLTAWTGLLSVAAMTVVLLLTYAGKGRARTAYAAPALGLLLAMLAPI